MEKIKILGIAPYESMKAAMEQAAAKHEECELSVYVGDLDEGVRIASSLSSQYDIVVSRGGTAELIREHTDMPVAEIRISIYDILAAIRLAQRCSDKFAIVGFPNIVSVSRMVCELLKYDTQVIAIHSEDEAKTALLGLKQKGCSMVICDAVAHTSALRAGLNSILVASGEYAIETALNEAAAQCKSIRKVKEQNRLLSMAFAEVDQYIFIFDSENRLRHCTCAATKEEALTKLLRQELKANPSEGVRKFFLNCMGDRYACRSSRIGLDGESYACFTLKRELLAHIESGVRSYSPEEVQASILDGAYGGNIKLPASCMENIDAYAKTTMPVIITGEEGSGKEYAARLIYSLSAQRGNLFYVIDAKLASDKIWSKLLNSPESPLNGKNQVFLFADIDMMPQERQKKFISFLEDSNLRKGNRLIFTCRLNESGESEGMLYRHLYNKVPSLSLAIPPLRARHSELPGMASLFAGALNSRLSKQVAGFEDDAMELLQSFPWPGNLTQFRRVLTELVATSKTAYITADQVKKALREESGKAVSSGASQALDLNRPLYDITRDIAMMILAQENYNHSEAANKLGISRTTLWRMENQSAPAKTRNAR
ncbi:MAG: PrpR N-terminal domain-containing protein [Clostridiales bacterium]|nr:PrpR N-terminal domain-containing protein [Clostridiales bacterium]